MTFQNAVRRMEAHYREAPNVERRGQAYFNWLFDHNQRLAVAITGSNVDPFYNDGLIGPFLEHLASIEEAWN